MLRYPIVPWSLANRSTLETVRMCSHQALDVGLADELFHHIHEMTLRHDSIDLVFHCVRPETVHVAEQVFRTTRMTQKFCLGFRKPFHTERIPDYGRSCSGIPSSLDNARDINSIAVAGVSTPEKAVDTRMPSAQMLQEPLVSVTNVARVLLCKHSVQKLSWPVHKMLNLLRSLTLANSGCMRIHTGRISFS